MKIEELKKLEIDELIKMLKILKKINEENSKRIEDCVNAIFGIGEVDE